MPTDAPVAPPTGTPAADNPSLPGPDRLDGEAESLWAAGLRVEALAVMADELAATPDDQPLRRLYAERLMTVHRYAEALQTVAPLGPQADALRGRAHYLLGEFAPAAPLLAATASGQGPTATLMLMDALEALGRGDEAVAVAEQAGERLGAEHPQLLAFRGRRAALAERPEDAADLFRQALAADPLQLEALYGLGQALLRTGARTEALEVLQRHRELVPLRDRYDFALRAVDLAPTRASNHAQLGDVLRSLGQHDEALERFAHAQTLATPDEVVAVTLRHARAILDVTEDVERCIALLDEVASTGSDPRLPVRAGDVLMRAGRLGEAVMRFEWAQRMRPEDVQIGARLTRALDALEAEVEAVRAHGKPLDPHGTPPGDHR